MDLGVRGTLKFWIKSLLSDSIEFNFIKRFFCSQKMEGENPDVVFVKVDVDDNSVSEKIQSIIMWVLVINKIKSCD